MLKETKYNILIVSSSEKFLQSISKFLISYLHSSCTVATSLNQASRLLLERNYQILIVSSPGGDQNIIDFALNANLSDITFGNTLSIPYPNNGVSESTVAIVCLD